MERSPSHENADAVLALVQTANRDREIRYNAPGSRQLMPLGPGTRLGPYEIVSAIGAGGMGEVYKAKDTRLDRIVAIKVLPSHVSDDPALRERFDREARTVAALNHPHICTLHDVGRHEGTDYLVLEFLEGQTLANRLTRGELPLDQALAIAIQIADALDKAHRAGIVHRDLKPGNIMLTKAGSKLLDFGLAKVTPGVIAASGLSVAPTMQSPVTMRGTILGTLQYMAPEQIEGQEADARTDIFAFGTVLFEMVTGKRAFDGKSQASLTAAILEREPPAMSSLQPMTPASLEHVVSRCLAKNPDERWQTAGDVMRELKWITQTGSQTSVSSRDEMERLRRERLTRVALLVAALVAITATVLMWRDRGAVPPVRIANLTLNDEADLHASSPQGIGLLVSPDGSRIVSQAPRGDRRMFMRNLDQPASMSLPNTELGRVMFISPDGRSVGFSNITALKQISLIDGSVTSVSQTDTITTTAAISADGRIVYSMGLGLWLVSPEGGRPRPLTMLANSEQSQSVAGFLPDGKTLLFTNWLADNPRIEALTFATGERRVIVEQASGGQYVSTGHLLFVRDGALFAAPFDVDRLSAGVAVRVLDRIRTNLLGVPKLGVSRDGGILAYAEPARVSLVWVTRTGLETPLDLPPRQFQFVRISGDGQRIAFADEASIWVADLTRGGSTRVSSERFIYGSLDWSPDDSQLAYSALYNLVTRAVDGTGTPRQLGATLPVWKLAPSWSPDGKTIAYSAYFGATNADIYVQAADGSGPPRAFVTTPAYDAGPQFSPDGRFLAYASSETGRLEVYVTPFPGPGPKWPVSTTGGTHARWSRDGRELFYRNGDDVMAAPITTTPRFSAGKPALLFRGRYSYGSGLGLATYDVAPDGRFLMLKNEDETVERPHIVINWAEELKRLVPTN